MISFTKADCGRARVDGKLPQEITRNVFQFSLHVVMP
jgi:hypothetical protein